MPNQISQPNVLLFPQIDCQHRPSGCQLFWKCLVFIWTLELQPSPPPLPQPKQNTCFHSASLPNLKRFPGMSVELLLLLTSTKLFPRTQTTRCFATLFKSPIVNSEFCTSHRLLQFTCRDATQFCQKRSKKSPTRSKQIPTR